MAERKPLVKYIPKNFNPNLIQKRGRARDSLINVRNMLPMTIRCNTCSNYHYLGTKFTMRMQICNDEMYLGIKIFRFYFRCTHCCNQITFKTDPKNAEYVVETGGVRNYDPRRDIQQAQKVLKKMKTEQQQGDTMKTLENKTYDSKREMQLMKVLQEIRNQNKRHATFQSQDLLKKLYEAQILQFAETQQESQAMEQQYEKKVTQWNQKHNQKKSFNEKMVMLKQQMEKDKAKEESLKRRLKPNIKVISKKRQIQKDGHSSIQQLPCQPASSNIKQNDSGKQQ